MSDYDLQVAAAVRATALDSRGAFTWFGKRYAPFRGRAQRTLSPEAARDMLLGSLQWVLYRNFYGRGVAAPASEQLVVSAASRSDTFVAALATANSGAGSWQEGWELLEKRGAEAVLRRGGLKIRADPIDLREADGTPDGRWSVLRPKGSDNLSPGYYVAFGDIELVESEAGELLRFYWNLSAEGAVTLIRHVTSVLNRAQLPFALKVLQDPVGYDRCDAGVLYVRGRDYPAVAAALEQIYPEIASGLRPGTPVFTKVLAAGVGLAESPDAGQSFGLHRCRLLADAILRAHEGRKRLLADRLRAVSDCFAAAGVMLEQPYLNPNSRDIYAPLRAGAGLHTAAAPTIAFGSGAPDKLLRTAEEIGERLCQQAIWHGDRCTWLGPEPWASSAVPAAYSWAWKPAGPDLYTGTSGMALFLAELHATTGNRRAGETALGAARRALAALDAVPKASRLGLFVGWPGIALAAARAGQLLVEPKLCAAASHLLSRCVSEARASEGVDLLMGRAGAVASFVVLADALQDSSLLEFARVLADDLLSSAVSLGSGCAWQSAPSARERPLTGFSHGTAGVGYALLELHLATGDQRYREGAEKAFAYERDLFDAAAKNWPDLRNIPRRYRSGPLPFMTAWCHGAGGIALSRLRAFELLKDDRYKVEAITALETTRGAVESALQQRTGDFSLCHGLAGNADVLLHGERMLSPDWSDSSAAVMRVAELGIDRYASRGLPWPCGAGVGEAPGLMLGLAGIGHFYLRLHDAAVSSVLLPQSAEFRTRDGMRGYRVKASSS